MIGIYYFRIDWGKLMPQMGVIAHMKDSIMDWFICNININKTKYFRLWLDLWKTLKRPKRDLRETSESPQRALRDTVIDTF